MIVRLTPEPIRRLTATDLGLAVEAGPGVSEDISPPVDLVDRKPIADDDEIFKRVKDLIADHGGVIFVGPSGTGKSYYARRIALGLAKGNETRCRFVQFHPSYQYEDFMEGFRPSSDGKGFEMRAQHFVALSQQALHDPDHLYVLVIDELSRGNPGRIFGESLTYLEYSKRGMFFYLASGRNFVVPPNLVILATMNPLDHGADEVDAAFDRRFAKIRMEPDRAQLGEFLDAAGMDPELRTSVFRFFDFVNARSAGNPYLSLGHTYFKGVGDVSALERLWEHQLRFNVEKAYPFDTEGLEEVFAAWDRVIRPRSTVTVVVDDGTAAVRAQP